MLIITFLLGVGSALCFAASRCPLGRAIAFGFGQLASEQERGQRAR